MTGSRIQRLFNWLITMKFVLTSQPSTILPHALASSPRLLRGRALMAAIHEEPTGARLPFPFLTYYVLPHLVVTLVVALRPRLFWRLSTLIAVISAQLYAVRFTTGDSYQNYSTGTAIGTLAFTFAWLLLLSNPMAECRHETHRDSLEKSPLWKRVFYALCILVGTRGVGWNYQVHTSLYTVCICEVLTEPTD